MKHSQRDFEYKCPICVQPFPTVGSLRLHAKRRHGYQADLKVSGKGDEVTFTGTQVVQQSSNYGTRLGGGYVKERNRVAVREFSCPTCEAGATKPCFSIIDGRRHGLRPHAARLAMAHNKIKRRN